MDDKEIKVVMIFFARENETDKRINDNRVVVHDVR